jgi:carboxyl-terminal processing protease
MITKRKAVIIALIVALVSGSSAFLASKVIGITLGSTVLVPKNEYAELVDIYDRYGKVDVLENYIENNYLGEYDTDNLVDGAIKGMFESLDDPYSVYMNKEEFKQFTEVSTGKFVGIGIVVTQNDDNMIEIVTPMEGTPGESAGLKTGDKILKVDDKEFTGKQLDIAVSHIKGEKGTKVKLTILRERPEKEPETFEVEIIRDEITTESVKSQLIKDDIGYVRLSTFDESAYNEFKRQIAELDSQGMERLIIDLRGNGGGSLNICAQITDELIGKETIVYTEDKKGEREYLKSDSNKIGKPLVILVDEGSASASEILTAAVQDTGEGTIVGMKTYGKGVVQIVNDLPDGSGFKLTISEYFSPSGRSINKKGIEPDIKVELPEETESIGIDSLEEDIQLQKAIETVSQK